MYSQVPSMISFSHPKRTISLCRLAEALVARFDYSGQRPDIESAVSLLREACLGRQDQIPYLCAALLNKFLNFRGFDERDEAIRLWKTYNRYRDADMIERRAEVQLSQGVPGNLSTLDSAISLFREALLSHPTNSPYRPNCLHRLATTLWLRYKYTNELPYLTEGNMMAGQLLDTLRHIYPPGCKLSETCGRILCEMYEYSKEHSVLENAIAEFRRAVASKASPVPMRLQAARSWARHADAYDHGSCLEAYQVAIAFLPQLPLLNLRSESVSDGLGREASSCAIYRRDFARAVEFLEEGRSLFWSQTLQRRTSSDSVRLAAPEAAQRLTDISNDLGRRFRYDLSSGTLLSQNGPEEASGDRLREEWSMTIEHVREMDGYGDFLRPKTLSGLRSAASHGPVVILNGSHGAWRAYSCSALIMTLTGVQHVPLPGFTLGHAESFVQIIRAMTRGAGHLPDGLDGILQLVEDGADYVIRQPIPDQLDTGLQESSDYATRQAIRVAAPKTSSDSIFRWVLAQLWTGVVEPIVRTLKLEVGSICFSSVHPD